jgi:hypothetical protein
MNRARLFPIGVSTLLTTLLCASFVALTGCSGSTYSLGIAPADAGDGGSAAGPTNDTACVGSGCSGGPDHPGNGTDSGTNSPITGSSCTETMTPVACTGGATGYACAANGNPENDSLIALSCTSGAIVGFELQYCCFPWPGTGGPCEPLPHFPCGDNSYPYQCTPGAGPSDVDAKLSCGMAFPDPNGNDNYCCTYQ